MAFSSNIGKEQRRAILQSSLMLFETELFQRSIEVGIDPDTYDYTTFVLKEPPVTHSEVRISELLEHIKLVNRKLEQLD